MKAGPMATAQGVIRKQSGSVEAFRANWRERVESYRYHFKRGMPENQIQFAFQNHWRIFRQVMGDLRSGRVLEVGCGRGSMSAFFAEAGFETHLLDTSYEVLKIASANFGADGLKGAPICGDALALPYPDRTFDVIYSIGLFEHFAEITHPLREQIRVLRPGGVFLGYIVPERPFSVQTLALPLNAILHIGHALYHLMQPRGTRSRSAKAPVYRNDYSSAAYLSVLHRLKVADAGSFGMFPAPLISHSPGFPFSLMAPPLERALVRLWQRWFTPRQLQRRDPWTCSERWGLAFMVWARK
jgi:ubiquinone/menaquinone biosynthesis C-methylase UbiE